MTMRSVVMERRHMQSVTVTLFEQRYPDSVIGRAGRGRQARPATD